MAGMQEMQTWLENHLSYELDMLRHTIAVMHRTDEQLEYNAHYESFGVHARNLYQFLTDKKDNRILYAGEFLGNYEKPDINPVKGIMNTLNEQIFHPHKNRKIAMADKVHIDEACQLYKWFEKQMADFFKKAEAYRPRLFIQPYEQPCGKGGPLGWTGPGSTPSASSQPSSATTKF